MSNSLQKQKQPVINEQQMDTTNHKPIEPNCKCDTVHDTVQSYEPTVSVTVTAACEPTVRVTVTAQVSKPLLIVSVF